MFATLKYNIFNILIYLIIGYIFGSFPSGYLYAKSKNVNIFEVGSKNPGSTNIGRIFGKTAGRLVFALDIIKTILPIIICTVFYIIFNNNSFYRYNIFSDMLLSNTNDIDLFIANINYIKFTVGLGAIVGHNFSIFTSFKGGKGITVTVSTLACFNIFYALILFIIFKIFCKITNYVSLSSIIALIFMFISALIFSNLNLYPFNFKYNLLAPIYLFIYMSFGIIRHSTNIKKLINGTENKIH